MQRWYWRQGDPRLRCINGFGQRLGMGAGTLVGLDRGTWFDVLVLLARAAASWCVVLCVPNCAGWPPRDSWFLCAISEAGRGVLLVLSGRSVQSQADVCRRHEQRTAMTSMAKEKKRHGDLLYPRWVSRRLSFCASQVLARRFWPIAACGPVIDSHLQPQAPRSDFFAAATQRSR